jgi:hypothetical protein
MCTSMCSELLSLELQLMLVFSLVVVSPESEYSQPVSETISLIDTSSDVVM